MDLPRTNHDVPFDITRASHVVLTVKDLEASRQFYTEVIGLIVTEADSDTLYLRGIEEACDHSLVLRRAREAPACIRIGLRVFRDAGGIVQLRPRIPTRHPLPAGKRKEGHRPRRRVCRRRMSHSCCRGLR